MSKIDAIELLEMIPPSLLEDLSLETDVDYKVHKLQGSLMFSLLLYGMLQEDRLSLRTLEDDFNSSKFKFFFGVSKDLTTRHSSLGDRLATMKVSYFAKIYEAVYIIFSKHYDDKSALKHNIRRIDSVMVCEEARKLSKGMSVGRKKNGKKQIKISLSLTNMFPSSFELFTSQSALSEDVALPIELFKTFAKDDQNVIVTFDRGISAHKVYAQLSKDEQAFVTRIKANSKHETVRKIPRIAGEFYGNLTIISEKEIKFKKHPKRSYRLIEGINDSGKKLLFLTNRWDMSIMEVVECYRRRWDIEVFFRFLKQELNLSHLVSMNENGIQIILYMTMILAMLLLVYKKRNQYGYKTAKRRFRMELDTYITALIVEYCGGDSSKWVNTTRDSFS